MQEKQVDAAEQWERGEGDRKQRELSCQNQRQGTKEKQDDRKADENEGKVELIELIFTFQGISSCLS